MYGVWAKPCSTPLSLVSVRGPVLVTMTVSRSRSERSADEVEDVVSESRREAAACLIDVVVSVPLMIHVVSNKENVHSAIETRKAESERCCRRSLVVVVSVRLALQLPKDNAVRINTTVTSLSNSAFEARQLLCVALRLLADGFDNLFIVDLNCFTGVLGFGFAQLGYNFGFLLEHGFVVGFAILAAI